MEEALQWLENKAIIYRQAFEKDYVVDLDAMMKEINGAVHDVAVEADMIAQAREL